MSEAERTITLHTFASVKGGVGKSTLSVVTGKLLAERGRVPVVVDCDLTGTSLADGLRLCAPRFALPSDGSLDADARPTGKFLALDETRRLRRQRNDNGQSDHMSPLVYLNDLLDAVQDSRPMGVEVALWRHEHADGVHYLPSSSVYRDVLKSLDWLDHRDPFAWARAFLWVLDRLATTMTSLTDVIVDLPPGTWGFPHEMMVIVSTLESGKPLPDGYPQWRDAPIRWRTNPFLVTSSDGNDLLPALEYVGRQRARLPRLQPLANRFAEGENLVLDRVSALLGPTLAASGLNVLFSRFPEMANLRNIFKGGRVDLNDELRNQAPVLRIEDVA